MKRRLLFLFSLCNLLSSCYKNHLYVQQEWVDREFLASVKMNTPDPRKVCLPEGQRLLISWDFPRSLFQEHLMLIVTVRLWDNTQQVLFHPVERKRDYTAFYFPNNQPDTDRRILTYRVQAMNGEGEIIETWEHHFWTELIDIDRPAASFKRVSVSSHPMQGSVIEMP